MQTTDRRIFALAIVNIGNTDGQSEMTGSREDRMTMAVMTARASRTLKLFQNLISHPENKPKRYEISIR